MSSEKEREILNGVKAGGERNNPDIEPDIQKLKRRLKILRETIAYKGDDREFIDHQMIDLAYSESLPVEFTYYQNQNLEQLYQAEERLVQDLACLGYDASREAERAREEMETENMNEEVDLDDLDDD